MKKINKKLLFITSLVTLLPVFIGLLFWSYFPNELPIHFNLSGQADNYGSKFFSLIILPFMLLGVHLLCVFVTTKDPKSLNIGRKVSSLIYWLIPIISCIEMLAIYLPALKIISPNIIFMNLILGLIFIVVGNYLPKVKQNYTVGIKLPWTLNNEENWNKTHRLAGKLWVVGGIIILLDGLFGVTGEYLTFGVLAMKVS